MIFPYKSIFYDVGLEIACDNLDGNLFPALGDGRRVAIARESITMKMTLKSVIAVALVSLAMATGAGAANAGACVSGTLASYEALGATGCTIGNMIFFDFSWRPTATSGASAPPDTIEMATPDGFGFDFNGLFYATGTATSADALLTYTAKTTDGANTIDKATLL